MTSLHTLILAVVVGNLVSAALFILFAAGCWALGKALGLDQP